MSTPSSTTWGRNVRGHRQAVTVGGRIPPARGAGAWTGDAASGKVQQTDTHLREHPALSRLDDPAPAARCGVRSRVCIGTDPFHTPAALRDAFVNAFASEGFRVAVDTPFSGALVPVRYYRRDPRVQSVMVEVNRRLYLDEATGLATKGFAKVAATVQAYCIAVLYGL